MFYHASQVGGIKVLEPNVSNHNEPLLYFSQKRENVLVYLSNAIEKFCKETGFAHTGKWHKWASYGFDENGIMQLDEYYPHALEDTYKGVSGDIYSVESLGDAKDIQIPNAFATQCKVPVVGVEYIEDSYAEILKAEKEGLIKVRRYQDMSDEMHAWIEKTIKAEYTQAKNEPDYRYFLKAKFDFLNMDNTARFTGIAREYTQSRPGYAAALLDCLFENYGFSESSVVADVGSGTGKFAKQLLDRGCFVFGVEPNADMRGIAENELFGFDNFKSVDGAAENTTLPDGSVDFITVAQAFHWFDGARFKEECLRILKPHGVVCLIWNTRKEDADINCQLYKIYAKFCPDFKGFHGGTKTHDERIRSFFDENYEYLTFENTLCFDRDTFIKRSLSSSFSLKKGDRDFDSYIAELNALFDRFEVDGIAQVDNQTVLYVGKIQK